MNNNLIIHTSNYPYSIGWAITNKCNLRCIHCNMDSGNKLGDELTKDECFKIIDELNSKKVQRICFFGGEPLIRKDFFDIANYAIEKGIPSENIFMDHAGFSTYDSIYRAKDIFQAKKVIIVTQKYHLYRALYIANKLGLEAYGVGADPRKYVGATYRETREILARDKDFVKCIFKPNPTYLGDTIPVSGNGDVTNDNE